MIIIIYMPTVWSDLRNITLMDHPQLIWSFNRLSLLPNGAPFCTNQLRSSSVCFCTSTVAKILHWNLACCCTEKPTSSVPRCYCKRHQRSLNSLAPAQFLAIGVSALWSDLYSWYWLAADKWMPSQPNLACTQARSPSNFPLWFQTEMPSNTLVLCFSSIFIKSIFTAYKLKCLPFFSSTVLPWILLRRQCGMPKCGVSLIMIARWVRPWLQSIVGNDTRQLCYALTVCVEKRIIVSNHEYYYVRAIRLYFMEVNSLHIIDAFPSFAKKHDLIHLSCYVKSRHHSCIYSNSQICLQTSTERMAHDNCSPFWHSTTNLKMSSCVQEYVYHRIRR